MTGASPGRLAVVFVAAVALGAWWSIPRPSPQPSLSPQPAEARRAGDKSSAPSEFAPAQRSATTPPAAGSPAPAPATPPPRDPLRAAGLRARADALLKDAKIPEAVDAFDAAIEADPSSARNHGDLGRLLRDLTAIDRALYHLRRAAELDPGNADRWIELANAYYLKPSPGDAWKAEKRARQADPNLKLRRGRGGLLERADDTAAAGKQGTTLTRPAGP